MLGTKVSILVDWQVTSTIVFTTFLDNLVGNWLIQDDWVIDNVIVLTNFHFLEKERNVSPRIIVRIITTSIIKVLFSIFVKIQQNLMELTKDRRKVKVTIVQLVLRIKEV